MPRRTLFWILVITMVSLVCWRSVRSAPEDQYKEFFDLFADTLQHVESSHFDPPDRESLLEGSLRGVTKRLDRYSDYITEEELNRFRDAVRQEFGGVGIQISLSDDELTVITPLPGTPAQKAGVQAGDTIVAIEGESMERILQGPPDKRIEEAVKRLKGPPGSQVTITVLHEGSDQPEEITLTRAIIHVDSVKGVEYTGDGQWDFMIDKDRKIGYMWVEQFHDNTAEEVEHALRRLQEQGMQALVLDLRFNPGGLLTSAVEVADLFVSQGRIVSTRTRGSDEVVFRAHRSGTYEGFLMAVLINRYSASASEIVAACLQDHERAVLVGERTWGKGSVQNVIDLGDDHGAMKLTTASYHRPSGANIDRPDHPGENDTWGVQPDEGFEVPLADAEELNGKSKNERDRAELEAMGQYWQDRRQREVLLTAGQERPTNQFVDRQLRRALEHLRSQVK